MTKQTLLNMVEAQAKSKFGVYFSLNCQCYNITPPWEKLEFIYYI